MKRYIQFPIVLLLTLAIVSISRNSLAWAGADPVVVAQPVAGDSQMDTTQSDLDVELGSVKPPSPDIIIDRSGSYSVGGICSLVIDYKIPQLSDKIYVQEFAGIALPKEQGQLYLPGCDVLHYKSNQFRNEMGAEEGSWKICFASRPDKTTTIQYLNKFSSETLVWTALETTNENQQACASANFSGLYAPSGK